MNAETNKVFVFDLDNTLIKTDRANNLAMLKQSIRS